MTLPWWSEILIAQLGRITRTDRVRRNHALEHATITVVAEQYPSILLSGRSNTRGFFFFGDVETDVLRSSSNEALRRLRAGEAELAIHPRCGTNLAVAGILSGVSAAAAAHLRPKHNRVPYAILASLAALVIAPGLGTEVQRRVTTLANPGGLEIESVVRRQFPLVRSAVHWVRTRPA